MSWPLFKQNILKHPADSISSIDIFSNIFASEYDNAIRRGRDPVNGISVLVTNKIILQSQLSAILKSSLPINQKYSLLDRIGPVIISYWSNVVMGGLPIPLIPAPGSISNISVTSNVINNFGSWNTLKLDTPTDNRELFLDMFILVATTHLTTISGVINTISLYPVPPPAIPTPAPGLIPWAGYVV